MTVHVRRLLATPRYAQIGAALAPIHDAFVAALEGFGEGGERNRLVVGRENPIELRVDQVRGLAFTIGGNDCWTTRDGRQLVRNDTVQGRVFLGYCVGAERYLSAQDFAIVLTRICAGDLALTRESDVAQFVNLVVREPSIEPDVELLTWVSAAERIASGHGREYFVQQIPGLSSSFDILHDEMPPRAQFGDILQPGATALADTTRPAHQARVLVRALPACHDEVAALADDAARSAAFARHADELSHYLRDRLLDRVLAAARAGGEWPLD